MQVHLGNNSGALTGIIYSSRERATGIFDVPHFKEWTGGFSQLRRILVIQGSPGSEKSVLWKLRLNPANTTVRCLIVSHHDPSRAEVLRCIRIGCFGTKKR